MEKQKYIVLSDKKIFDSNLRTLVNRKADFLYITEGSVEKVSYGSRAWSHLNLADSGGRGHHLSKLFMADIDKWLEKNGATQVQYDSNYREQMFNLHGIEKSIGRQLVMVDINDCYWRTAHLLGYISEETYLKGMKLKAWKLGRNACIGSLCKSRTELPYEGGKPQYNKRRVIRAKMEYQYIRNHIIHHVYNIFNDMFLQFGNSFYMFLTDCLVTEYDKLKEVQKILNGYNYRTKHKPVEFTKLDREERKIHWLDFQSSSFDEFGREGKAPKDKYYIYSNAQVVQSTLLSGVDHFKGVDYR
jgi:hypothetical protein